MIHRWPHNMSRFYICRRELADERSEAADVAAAAAAELRAAKKKHEIALQVRHNFSGLALFGKSPRQCRQRLCHDE